MNPAAFGPVEAWSSLKHPNIVQVREAFTSQAFNDNCMHFFLRPLSRST